MGVRCFRPSGGRRRREEGVPRVQTLTQLPAALRRAGLQPPCPWLPSVHGVNRAENSHFSGDSTGEGPGRAQIPAEARSFPRLLPSDRQPRSLPPGARLPLADKASGPAPRTLGIPALGFLRCFLPLCTCCHEEMLASLSLGNDCPSLKMVRSLVPQGVIWGITGKTPGLHPSFVPQWTQCSKQYIFSTQIYIT